MDDRRRRMSTGKRIQKKLRRKNKRKRMVREKKKKKKNLFSSLESSFVPWKTDFPSIKVFIYSFAFNYLYDLSIVKLYPS